MSENFNGGVEYCEVCGKPKEAWINFSERFGGRQKKRIMCDCEVKAYKQKQTEQEEREKRIREEAKRRGRGE